MIPNLQLKLHDLHHSSPFYYATFYSFSKILFIHHSLLALPTYAPRLLYLLAFLTSHINCYWPRHAVVEALPSQLLIPTVWPTPPCLLALLISERPTWTQSIAAWDSPTPNTFFFFFFLYKSCLPFPWSFHLYFSLGDIQVSVKTLSKCYLLACSPLKKEKKTTSIII